MLGLLNECEGQQKHLPDLMTLECPVFLGQLPSKDCQQLPAFCTFEDHLLLIGDQGEIFFLVDSPYKSARILCIPGTRAFQNCTEYWFSIGGAQKTRRQTAILRCLHVLQAFDLPGTPTMIITVYFGTWKIGGNCLQPRQSYR